MESDRNEAPAVISHLSAKAARTLAVEILLADIEWLQDDVLESALYLLQERLQAELPATRTDHIPGDISA